MMIKVVPYMKIIFSNDINLQNIYKNVDVGNDSIEMQSSSQITNDEKGTTIISESELFVFESYDTPSLPILKINKGFIWMIMNANRVICNAGIFIPLVEFIQLGIYLIKVIFE